jgi:hypothetical protein
MANIPPGIPPSTCLPLGARGYAGVGSSLSTPAVEARSGELPIERMPPWIPGAPHRRASYIGAFRTTRKGCCTDQRAGDVIKLARGDAS